MGRIFWTFHNANEKNDKSVLIVDDYEVFATEHVYQGDSLNLH